jgi:hypothetical protein
MTQNVNLSPLRVNDLYEFLMFASYSFLRDIHIYEFKTGEN